MVYTRFAVKSKILLIFSIYSLLAKLMFTGLLFVMENMCKNIKLVSCAV